MEARYSLKRKRTQVISSGSEEDVGSTFLDVSYESLTRKPNDFIEEECSESSGSGSESNLTSESDGKESCESDTSMEKKNIIHAKITEVDNKIAHLFKQRKQLVHQLNTATALPESD